MYQRNNIYFTSIDSCQCWFLADDSLLNGYRWRKLHTNTQTVIACLGLGFLSGRLYIMINFSAIVVSAPQMAIVVAVAVIDAAVVVAAIVLLLDCLCPQNMNGYTTDKANNTPARVQE